jgi:hypothetical protein
LKDLKLPNRKLIKEHSKAQEEFIAKNTGGRRSPSSGAWIYDDGDVDADHYIIECKLSGNPEKPAKSISLKLSDFEKVFDEAMLNKKSPAMALRIYNPESILADHKGNVDFVCVTLKEWKSLLWEANLDG